jgi:lipoprotein-releasing system ATP-binding protein
MITAKGIYKSYDKLQVLKGIDLEVAKGEIVSVTGPSGAGKSTLLHILGTLDLPDKGTLDINSVTIHDLGKKQLSRFRNEQIGFVFQFHHLLPEFTALENICIPSLIGKRDAAMAKKRALELLNFMSLHNRAEHKPSELSGGEQQRVAVARALINNPSVVMADEPSGNLDAENARQLHELFFNLRKEFNQTFIVATHNEDLANMADRKLLMRDGKFI